MTRFGKLDECCSVPQILLEKIRIPYRFDTVTGDRGFTGVQGIC